MMLGGGGEGGELLDVHLVRAESSAGVLTA